MINLSELQKDVTEYYGKTLLTQADLKTNACCVGDPGYSTKEAEVLTKIHDEIISKFYGCGSPIPQGIEGCTVIDLGCGTGRDCYLASAMVGQEGHVIGIDMTEEQLDVANKHIEYHREVFGLEKSNVEFKKGLIEDLAASGIHDNSVDCVISNCVINLSGNKEQVFKEIWRVLKPGGELYFSDVFSTRRIPKVLQDDKVLWGECLSGAMYIEDFRRLLERVGFNYYYTAKQSEITVGNKMIQLTLGDIKFYSITIRAFKIPELEDRCEDYGEEATYLGTIPGYENEYKFDKTHIFKKGEPMKVCRNFSLVLTKSRLAKHFQVTEMGNHLGLFGASSGGSCGTECGC